MRLVSLLLKNVSSGKQFFAPLNKTVMAMEVIDLIKLAGGGHDAAVRIAEAYRHRPAWQVFEVFEKLPSPEGVLQEGTGVPLPPVSCAVQPEAKETQPKSKLKSPLRPEVKRADQKS